MLISLAAFAFAAGNGYADVNEDEWYAEAVAALKEKGIMDGVGDNRFDPDGIFTRAQLATVLYRLADKPAVRGEDSFTDTEPGTWYSDAVLWASQTGVVSGYGNGLFGTTDPTTQEQLAVMLWRSAGSYVLGSEYADAGGAENRASDWAFDAVRWARVDGLLTDAIAFEPAAAATRGQVADMVYRYLQLLEKFSESDAVSGATPQAEKDGKNMVLKIAGSEVPVMWEENPSVEALREILPLTIQMSMYGGFEQVGSIGQSITRNDTQITTAPGDIVLYSGNQIVIFYGSNSWAYTRLGHVDLSQKEMTELLSKGNVTISITEG
jgi:hypothetical protein